MGIMDASRAAVLHSTEITHLEDHGYTFKVREKSLLRERFIPYLRNI